MPVRRREATDVSDVLLYNGLVLTQTAPAVATAVAVHDGRIVAVGDSADLLRGAHAGTKCIDLGGRTLVPGFNDAHAHIWKIGHLLTSMLDLRRVTSVAEIVGDVRRCADRLPPDAWLLGRGYNEAALHDEAVRAVKERATIVETAVSLILRTVESAVAIPDLSCTCSSLRLQGRA